MIHHEHDHDRGLAFDLQTLVDRRRALQLLGGVGLVTLAGCASGGDSASSSGSRATSSTSSTTAASTGATGPAACTEIPEETAGPFPGDGSNGPDVLSERGVVRRDIRSSFGPSSGVAEGVPLSIGFTVVSLADGCRPRPGAALYAWHCDREGLYSMYSDGAEDQNYLRGVQATGDDGRASFTSIFPGAYQGRWPHVHFEVYPGVDDATGARGKLATSQLALPEDACSAAYATDGYERSVTNFSGMSIEADMVFADGYAAQLGKVTGSVSDGYTVELTVAV
jgi:protocatechuate 3,4-dioxygenase beta subunit